MKIFLGGEGKSELGKWSESVETRDHSTLGDGMLAELAKRYSVPVEIVGARVWKDAITYRPGSHETRDQQKLAAIGLFAKEAGADVLVWSRDTDRDPKRKKLLDAVELPLPSAGGVANPALEAWAVGLRKLHKNPDALSKDRLNEMLKEEDLDHTEAHEEAARDSDLDTQTSVSLKEWLAKARSVLK